MSWLTAPVPALVLALLFSVFAGVVLPAVWSTQPARRQAAAAVLTQLLQAGRDIGDTRLPTLPPPPADAAPADHQRAHGEPAHPDNEA